MNDLVFEGFLESAMADATRINEESLCVRLAAEPDGNHPPTAYQGLVRGAEHFVRDASSRIHVERRPLPFRVCFEATYCRSVDPNLQFRVISTLPTLVHPNIRGGMVCLGTRFKPATRLLALVSQFHRIVTGRVAALQDPFDPDSARWFLDHMEEVRALKSPPLWRKPLAAQVRVEETPPRSADAEPHTDTGEAAR